MKDLPELPPALRVKNPRLPAKAKKLEPNAYIDVKDAKAANCVVAYGRYRGWVMTRRSANGTTRIWRIS